LVVLTRKDATFWPAGTKTDAGTRRTAEFELESNTVIPPAGAGADSLTSPAVVNPPVTGEDMCSFAIVIVETGVKFATKVRSAVAVKL
jgi:hypothetical protein